MSMSGFPRTCASSVLTLWLGLAPSPASPVQPPPTFPSGAEVVLFDLVVHDKGGKALSDLRADEVTVLEDAKPCEVRSFRLVQAEAALDAARPGRPASPDASSTTAPRTGAAGMANLVLLVFDQLGPQAARIARKTALDFVSRPFPANTWFTTLKTGQGLQVLRNFTEDRASLRPAIETATLGGERGQEASTDGSEATLTDQAFKAGLAAARNQSDAEARLHGAGAAGQSTTGSPGLGFVEAQMQQVEATMLRSEDLMERERRGWSSLDPLLSIAEGLAAVPGRKTLLYFSEGLNVPHPVEDRFRLAIGQANRSHLTFYSFDVRGLTTDSPLTQAREATDLAATLSPAGDGLAAQETAEDALRLNFQGNLRELAEATGGFLVANTNDLVPGLERVGRDLRSYYEVAYVPPRRANDGTYRKIEVRVSRPGATVRTRRGYYALPPGSPVVQPYELPLVAALGATEPPRDFEYRASALLFGPKGQEREAVVLVAVPLGTVQVTRDEAARRYRLHLSALAHVKDAEGRIVARLSEDWPVDGPLDQAAGLRVGQTAFKSVVSLAPGRYTLETAVQDRTSGRTSAGLTSFEVPPAGSGPAVSILVVRRTEPASGSTAQTDPLRLDAMTVVPDVAPALRRATRPELPVFLSVYPAAGGGPVSVDLEVRSGDSVLARATPDLPAPDADGRIASLVRFPTATFVPGRYDLVAVARQGPATTEAGASFEVLTDLGPRLVAPVPSPPTRPKAESADAATAALLEKGGRYVADYERSFRNLVAVETYNQRTEQVTPERDAPLQRRRIIRSDIVFVALPGPMLWGTFRDVFEVDGSLIRDRQARLKSLFSRPQADAVAQANAILRESARYNLGTARRTVNIPTLALLFLHPANQGRFAFKAKGHEKVQGREAAVLEFTEVARPTLVHDALHGDLPAKGRFWLDPDLGTVIRSDVVYRFEPNRALAWVATEFQPEPGLDIWVPSEMKERYEDLENDEPGSQVFLIPVEATARYAQYQRFSVDVIDETARVPEVPSTPRP
jgi:VWFA-related protein